MGLFESHVPVESITVMVQKEVADRMQTGPGSKDYGALSLAVQYYAEPEIVANVPPNCFMPRPKVGSAVIRLKRHKEPPVQVQNEKLMFRLIRASFNQRRKTMANGLKNSQELNYTKEQVESAISACGLPLNIRGEALSLEQFAALTNAFAVRHPGDAATAENGLYDRKRVCKDPVAGRMLLLEDLLNLKGRRVEYLYRYPTYEKKL